ncbi:hypothetical protein JYU34_019936 [Plutella xylostella]|uniref:Myb-like domain-containing protein n=1 Tax=Plutella xylostella TaxID=51655 RepID=A0ABQ7PVL2_PLUXY|nr:hypothetical protein JYU34_019936 [Plutella xylostella]
MEQMVVKSEMQPNDEILLFYVDENGGNEEGVVTTIENMEQVSDGSVQQIYIEEANAIETMNEELTPDEPDEETGENWTHYEIKRLLVFYIDNKEAFITGATQKDFLWSVACKTMLVGKSPYSCNSKLQGLKKVYAKSLFDQNKGVSVTWHWFKMAHQAFHDDEFVETTLKELAQQEKLQAQAVFTQRKVQANRSVVDEKLMMVLKLYIKHKKNIKNVQKEFWSQGIWETIALEMGEDDAEYWHRRFLNFKHNYIRLLDKRRANGPQGINWPYMALFDEIYANDEEFQQKYQYRPEPPVASVNAGPVAVLNQNQWNDTENIVLVKYCFDCFDEFQDPTIPDNFLWNEVGRLLEKNAQTCKQKYEEMRNKHLDKYIAGSYDMSSRVPLDILYDNLISRTIEAEMVQLINTNKPASALTWKTAEIDDLAQFFYETIEMYKDPVCYYVCWAAIVKKLKKPLNNCRTQWLELVTLYRTILDDKKENPDMQIDWRYIELFDRLFDYGMDERLLEGYETIKAKEQTGKKSTENTSAGQKPPASPQQSAPGSDEESPAGRRAAGDSKAFQILEFYQKNKDKFKTSSRKQALWEILAKQIGMNATRCAHRFRNLKQVYTGYIQREINKPEMPIVWPYYQLCKKVFGYRALKSKLKNHKMDSDGEEEWSAKEIKQLINYFSDNFATISENPSELDVWGVLSSQTGKSASACRDKFMELRKSYRKLKTMKSRNAAVKVTWKYFNKFDDIYRAHENGVEQPMEVEELDDYEMVAVDEDFSKELQDDDDIQCIFVIPEGQDINDFSNAQMTTQDATQENGVQTEAATETDTQTDTQQTEPPKKTLTTWTKKSKKRMLLLHYNYLKSHKGQEIIPSAMWKEIAEQLTDKTPLSCRKMFAKLKANRLEAKDEDVKKKTPYFAILEKILALKPKFRKKAQENDSLKKGEKVYKDVPMPSEKVQQALEFYLQNIEEFVSPRFEKKYAWSNLSKAVGEPVSKVFNKVNYLKNHSNNTDEQDSPYKNLLQQISAKETVIKLNASEEKTILEQDMDDLAAWSDDEIEQLLIWYLANLDKFKNPKYVRKYLWLESSNILAKSPLACSKKMNEIRTEYRNMVREGPEQLSTWRFYELCQKIYGTGKQKTQE